MKTYAVIGMGFGDEGKGKVVSSLCEKHKNEFCIVVRFSGGSQASHKVVYNGIEHIFSNFGSGTLQGVPTLWNKECSFDPLSFMNEYKHLIMQGITPKIFVDSKCPLTTPYELIANRTCERTVSDGTCGMGYGKTIQREEDFYSLLFEDIYFPIVVEQKLENFKKYYKFEISEQAKKDFLNACHYISNDKRVERYFTGLRDYDVVIFEGSQGLMLDQHYGIFPNVTRSNVGTPIIYGGVIPYPNVYYVTRSYLTRHGNGNELMIKNAEFENSYEQNIYNTWQGNFKTGILNMDLLKYALMKDVDKPHSIKNLVINCMDIFEKGKDTHSLIVGGKLIEKLSKEQFVTIFQRELGIYKIFTSGDPHEIIKL